jgi:hypothetical protein
VPTLAPFPVEDPIAQLPAPLKQWGRLTEKWIDWFTTLGTQQNATSQRVRTVTLVDQSASIGATSIPTGALSAGLYRVTTYARITRAATTSSSLTVTIGWVESTIALTLSGAAMTGNTVTTVQTNTYLLRVDASSPLTYSTTYASVGGTTMQYRLDVVLERVDA